MIPYITLSVDSKRLFSEVYAVYFARVYVFGVFLLVAYGDVVVYRDGALNASSAMVAASASPQRLRLRHLP